MITTLLASLALAADPSALDDREAARTYASERIGTSELVSPSVFTPSKLNLFQGETKRPLSYPQFYDVAERPDLRKRHNRLVGTKVGLVLAGTASLVGGYLLTNASYNVPCVETHPDCGVLGTRNDDTMFTAGLGLSVGSLAFILPVPWVRPRPPAHEVRAEVIAHNRNLADQLGLQEETALAIDASQDSATVIPPTVVIPMPAPASSSSVPTYTHDR